MKSRIDECQIIDLKRHESPRLGSLSVAEGGMNLPFQIRRVFHIYDVPAGASRGGHAHREVYEFIVAASGSFTVTLNDGKKNKTFMLNRPFQGLLVVPGVWLSLQDFSSGSVALVMTSDLFSPEDHIKDFNEFLNLNNSHPSPQN